MLDQSVPRFDGLRGTQTSLTQAYVSQFVTGQTRYFKIGGSVGRGQWCECRDQLILINSTLYFEITSSRLFT